MDYVFQNSQVSDFVFQNFQVSDFVFQNFQVSDFVFQNSQVSDYVFQNSQRELDFIFQNSPRELNFIFQLIGWEWSEWSCLNWKYQKLHLFATRHSLLAHSSQNFSNFLLRTAHHFQSFSFVGASSESQHENEVC